jgi:hypothetical protein
MMSELLLANASHEPSEFLDGDRLIVAEIQDLPHRFFTANQFAQSLYDISNIRETSPTPLAGDGSLGSGVPAPGSFNDVFQRGVARFPI